MVYSHSETKESQAKPKINKSKSNQSANMSTLILSNSKNKKNDPNVLYNFLTLLQSRNKKYTSQKWH
jgi:hypothetical protein